jgi:ankyrin repeat protein
MRKRAVVFGILAAAALVITTALALHGPRIRVTVTREAVFQKTHPLYMLITGGGSIEDVRKMLLDDRSLVKAPLEFGELPMYYAAAGNRRDVVELLLEMGANVNARVEPDGSTPLEAAVSNEHVEMVDLLVERGADPTMVNSDGRSPIDIAVTLELDEILERSGER